MKTPAFFLFRLLRIGAVAALVGLVVLAGVRLAVWMTGEDRLHDDVLRGPEVFDWRAETADFGGLSGLVMAPDGAALLAGSDRGQFLAATLRRDAAGRITAISEPVPSPVTLASGLPPSRFKRDLEALSPLPGGGHAQAFEGFVRIETQAGPGGAPTPTHRWDRFAQLFGNRAFEALATLPDGRLLAIAERKDKADQALVVIRGEDGWRPGPPLPVPDGFAVTGADVGPDGCLYVIERRYGAATGFVSRLRRLRHAGGWQAEVLFVTAPATLGNLEAVSGWRDAEGAVVLDLVADNNFLPFTPTRLIELRLRPGVACRLDL